MVIGVATDDPLEYVLHPDASSDTVPLKLVRIIYNSIQVLWFSLMVVLQLVMEIFYCTDKGGRTRGDVETFEVRNGNGTTFVVRGSGDAEFAGITTGSV